MKYLKLMIFLVLGVVILSKDMPVNKETIFFKDYDINNISMARTMSAFPNENGLVTNCASVGFLNNNFYNIIYEYAEFEDISNNNIIKTNDFDFISFTSPKGGIYYKNIKKDISENAHKFRFDMHEFGVASVNESINTENMFVGLNIKGYFADVMQGKIDSNSIDLTLDKGKGAGVDLGIIYRKENIYTSFSYKDIYTKIFFEEFDDIKINSRINFSLGLDYLFMKYGFSIDKLFIDDTSINYGNSIELTVIKIPEEIAKYFLNDFTIKIRKGVISDKIIDGNLQHTVGLKVSNYKYYLNSALVSKNMEFWKDEKMMIKLALGGKF